MRQQALMQMDVNAALVAESEGIKVGSGFIFRLVANRT